MTHQSCSNSLDEVVPGGSSCSSSTTSREVYSLPLGHNGDVYLSQEEQNLVGICGGLAAETGAQTIVVGSPGTRVGNEVLVTVEGNANFTINHVGSSGQPLGDGAQKNASNPSGTGAAGAKKKLFKSREICLPIICIISVLSVLVIIIIWAVLDQKKTPDDGYFIPRDVWGGREPTSPPIAIDPAILAVIKHTGGHQCFDSKSCRARVRQIQKEHMETLKLPDISYNFLIGGDGNIYVGRGWGVQNGGRNDSLDVAFIGNFTENVPSVAMLSLGKRLLIWAPREDALDYSSYYVVNHNQTEPTDSPGENLFSAVASEYNHYSSDICYGNSTSGIVIEYDCPRSESYS